VLAAAANPLPRAVRGNVDRPPCMFWSRQKKDNKHQRFYLFPGQGGRAYHRKQWVILKTSLIVGLLVSALFALALYLTYRSPK
jgi:hypothetical protein